MFKTADELSENTLPPDVIPGEGEDTSNVVQMDTEVVEPERLNENAQDLTALKDKLFEALDLSAEMLAAGIAKHNLEQFWWKKLSAGEELDPMFYSSALQFVQNSTVTNKEELATLMKDSLSVEGNEVTYNFPLDKNRVLGEFTLPFPVRLAIPGPSVLSLNPQDLSYLIIQEYAKWLGSHILI